MFSLICDATGKQNKNQPHYDKRGTSRGVKKEGKWGRKDTARKNNRDVNIINEHLMHVWKCHDETLYYVQFNICQ
jgi:hypothetical protein